MTTAHDCGHRCACGPDLCSFGETKAEHPDIYETSYSPDYQEAHHA